jgi:hypothetical protein
MRSRDLFRLLGPMLLLGATALSGGCAQGTKPLLQPQEESDADSAVATTDAGVDARVDHEPDTSVGDVEPADPDGGDTSPGCSPAVCQIGEQLCVGQDQIATCVDDGNGCGTPGPATSCGSDKICSAGQCIDDPGACVDADGDGYGANCSAGPDCNDGDDSVHPNAAELCDGADNDCDGNTDEDFSSLNQSCTDGNGVCAASGTIRCNANQTGTYCDANANSSAASMEICDNLDNDCDGQTDEAMCSSCADDSNEPNQRSYEGTDLSSPKTIDNLVMCGDANTFDVDWFNLGHHNPGTSITIGLTQMTGTNAVGASYSNLDFDFWCDATYCGHVSGSQGTMDGSCGCPLNARWTVRVFAQDAPAAVGTPYSIQRY